MLNSEPINGLKPRDMLLNQTEKTVMETPDETLKRKLKENGQKTSGKGGNLDDEDGKSIVEEKSFEMNEDKISGRGTLKVRFQVNSPGRKSQSEKKDSTNGEMSSSLKNPKNEQLLVKSGKPEHMNSQTLVVKSSNQ